MQCPGRRSTCFQEAKSGSDRQGDFVVSLRTKASKKFLVPLPKHYTKQQQHAFHSALACRFGRWTWHASEDRTTKATTLVRKIKGKRSKSAYHGKKRSIWIPLAIQVFRQELKQELSHVLAFEGSDSSDLGRGCSSKCASKSTQQQKLTVHAFLGLQSSIGQSQRSKRAHIRHTAKKNQTNINHSIYFNGDRKWPHIVNGFRRSAFCIVPASRNTPR